MFYDCYGNDKIASGSVVPLFQKHFSQGGSITLMDGKVVIRYFMSIPEAVQLVIHILE